MMMYSIYISSRRYTRYQTLKTGIGRVFGAELD